MVKKNLLLIVSTVMYFLVSLNSCSVEWFGDFSGDMLKDTSTQFKFYDGKDTEKAGYFTKLLKLGETYSTQNLPGYADFKNDKLMQGYDFKGWQYVLKDDETEIPSTIAIDKESETVSSLKVDFNSYEFYAVWSVSLNTPYSVEYYFQNVSDDEYTLDSSRTLKLTGETFTQTKAEAPEVEGFTALAFDQVEIAAAGDAVVRIYYNRNSYTLSIDYNYDGLAVESKTLKYQAAVGLTAPERYGYEFNGWSLDSAGNEMFTETKMPAKDVKVWANWSRIMAKTDGVTITLPAATGEGSAVDVTFEIDSANKKISFSIEDKYAEYIWLVNGVKQSVSSHSFDFDYSSASPGIVEVVVIATDSSGYVYSETAEVRISNTGAEKL